MLPIANITTNIHSLALKRLIWRVKWPKYLYRILKTSERAAKQRLRPLTEKQLYKSGKKGTPSICGFNNHYLSTFNSGFSHLTPLLLGSLSNLALIESLISDLHTTRKFFYRYYYFIHPIRQCKFYT